MIIRITLLTLILASIFSTGCPRSKERDNKSDIINDNTNIIGKDWTPPSDRIPMFYDDSSPWEMDREANGLLQIFSYQLLVFRGIYGRDPETIREFLDSPGTIFWPVCPYTGKPYQYVDEITQSIESLGKFTFEIHNGKKWILSVIENNGQFKLVNYPYLFVSAYEKVAQSLTTNDDLRILGLYLNEQAYLQCYRYAGQYGKLPVSFQELMYGYLIVRDNWPDMSNLKSAADEGFFEIGITSDGMNYYQILHIPGNKISSYEMPYVPTDDPIWKMDQNPPSGGKEEIDILENKVPIASSLMFPTAESLPGEMCITKAEILGSE